ncbi:MAG: hypothetical protein JO172_02180 [Hyphomicrobiales bacterium]|nr:hypothetical protein [Hyphomicrobiales bacterium]
MRKGILTLLSAACLAGMAASPAFCETARINAVLQSFDSAVWRFQLAEIVGTLLAIEREDVEPCAFKIDDATARELSIWLERPSPEVSDTSPYVTRRDQVEGIMGALLKLNPDAVCDAAGQKLPVSLKGLLRR